MAIVDDNYTMGHPEHIFSAHQIFGNDLIKVGLQLQPVKSQYYIAEAFWNVEWDQHCDNIFNVVVKDSDGETVTTNGTPHYGITIYNVPIGSQLFVQGYLSLEMKTITRGFDQMKEFLDPGKWPHPEK